MCATYEMMTASLADTYCMQIDSGMDEDKAWDYLCAAIDYLTSTDPEMYPEQEFVLEVMVQIPATYP
jgi:hypothetical protein